MSGDMFKRITQDKASPVEVINLLKKAFEGGFTFGPEFSKVLADYILKLGQKKSELPSKINFLESIVKEFKQGDCWCYLGKPGLGGHCNACEALREYFEEK